MKASTVDHSMIAGHRYATGLCGHTPSDPRTEIPARGDEMKIRVQ
jgi:hypothetical protein